MLKNLSPLLSGGLLAVLDDMVEGDLVVLASDRLDGVGSAIRVVDLGEVTLEESAEAIVSVLPLPSDDTAPILYRHPGGEDLSDVACAIGGLASDAELRRVAVQPVTAEAFRVLTESAVARVVATGAEPGQAFAFRKGRCL